MDLDWIKFFRLDNKIFYYEGGETLAQVAQRGGRCPIPRNIQGQIGWGSEQPHLKTSLLTAEGLD